MTKPTLCRVELEWCLDASEVDAFVAGLKHDPHALVPTLSTSLSLESVEAHDRDVAGFRIVRAVFRAERPPFDETAT